MKHYVRLEDEYFYTSVIDGESTAIENVSDSGPETVSN